MIRVMLGMFITIAICTALSGCGNGGSGTTGGGGTATVREVPQERIPAPGSDISPEAKSGPGPAPTTPPTGN